MTQAVVRPYEGRDRARVRHICCETGYMGTPVDPLFSDRDLFADFFTRYYTDCEPASALVAEDAGEVQGYVIGCLQYDRYLRAQVRLMATSILPKVAARALAGRYDRNDRRFMWWVISRSWRETPSVPRPAAHFHINLMPGYRNGRIARRLIFTFFGMAERARVPALFGQIQTFPDRRPPKIFERYGFNLFDQRRITRFAHLNTREVYVSTFFKRYEYDA